MIPEMQKVVRTLATLAIIIGIIVFAVFSAQDKTGKTHNNNNQAQSAQVENNFDTIDENIKKAVPAADKPVLENELALQLKKEQAAETGNKQLMPKKSAGDFIYTVKSGDTLYDLALAYGISVDNIKYANNLTTDNLQLDQQLVMPVSGKIVAKIATPKENIKKKRLKDLVQVKEEAPQPRKAIRVASSRSGGRSVGELVSWDTAKNLFSRGETATITDVETGLSFRIKRKGGSNHADNEPLTSADAATMKNIYGGSWSWDRRAIVLKVGDKKIAASMAGMPHGSETIANNDFSGHFDIHFKGSMTHGSEYTKSRRPVVDGQHQAMVRKAAGL